MKTQETRTISSRGFLTLPTSFRDKGFNYQLEKREGLVAIYSKSKPGWTKENFEVFVIQEYPEYVLGDTVIPAKESMPANEDWGVWGFSCLTLDRAKIRMASLIERVKNAKEN